MGFCTTLLQAALHPPPSSFTPSTLQPASQVLHLIVAVAIVLLMRYSPEVAGTYDADFDVVPRAAMLLPPLILAVVWHRVRTRGGGGL